MELLSPPRLPRGQMTRGSWPPHRPPPPRMPRERGGSGMTAGPTSDTASGSAVVPARPDRSMQTGEGAACGVARAKHIEARGLRERVLREETRAAVCVSGKEACRVGPQRWRREVPRFASEEALAPVTAECSVEQGGEKCL